MGWKGSAPERWRGGASQEPAEGTPGGGKGGRRVEGGGDMNSAEPRGSGGVLLFDSLLLQLTSHRCAAFGCRQMQAAAAGALLESSRGIDSCSVSSSPQQQSMAGSKLKSESRGGFDRVSVIYTATHDTHKHKHAKNSKPPPSL